MAPTGAESVVVETRAGADRGAAVTNWGRFHHIGERYCHILVDSPWLYPFCEQTSPSVDIEIALGMRRREAEDEYEDEEEELMSDLETADMASEPEAEPEVYYRGP